MFKNNYRNVFAEIGKSETEIKTRLDKLTEEFFFGDDSFYHEVGDMGYLEDTGNHDARTEGMSYGMMLAVQLDRKDIFDRIWKWSKHYMYMTDGWNAGYFAWSCKPDGTRNSDGPAPDGEEYYAMALFFASHRWGDGEGIFNYSKEAKDLLRSCLHKGEGDTVGVPMWDIERKLILFGPACDFSDASYHLPHFYELFALWAYEEDREFWAGAAKASREYIAKSCHPATGMSPEYGEFDGSPMSRPLPWTHDRHDYFYSDAYRTAANIGLDCVWFGKDEGHFAAVPRLQHTLGIINRDEPYMTYEVDGTKLTQPALHPVGLMAATAMGSLAVRDKLSLTSPDPKVRLAAEWVEKLWNAPLCTGVRRYYDNCLYMFAFLALSGNYRIW